MRILLTIAVTLAITGAAHADLRDPLDSSVAFDRQDLSSKSGAEKALTEIETQLKETCRVKTTSNRLRGKIDRDCVSELLADAVTKINSPNLTAAYQRKTEATALAARR